MAVDIMVYRARVGSFHGYSRKRNYFFFHSSNYRNLFTRKNNIGTFDSSFYGRREWATTHKEFRLYLTAKSAFSSVYLSISVCLLLSSLLALCGDIHPNPGPRTWTDLSISHTNIRSIRAPDKIEHIRCELAGNFDIITVSETWLSSSCENVDLALTGFQKPYRKDRIDDSGYGGVLAWVSIRVSAKRRVDLELPQLELMWLEIRSRNNKFLLGVGYRQPSANEEFWQLFQDSLDKVLETDISSVVMVGDFNADPMTAAGSKFDLFTKMNNLQILIHEPTRVTETSSSILDQVLTNSPHFVTRAVVHPPIATCDHATVSVDLLFRIGKKSSYVRRMWDFSQANFEDYRNELESMTLADAITNDVDESCNNLTNQILSAAANHIPSKLVTVRQNDKPWYNNYLRRLLRVKNRYHAIAKRSNKSDDWVMFRAQRNFYNRELCRMKKEFNDKKLISLSLEGKKNPKKWWSLLKSIWNNKTVCSIPPISKDDITYSEECEKANIFNDFFLRASTVDDSNRVLPESNPPATILDSIVVTASEVIDQISLLDVNKSYGPDNISPKFIKEAHITLVPALVKLFNLSLTKCVFPASWKKANVLPLHKKDDTTILNNYRPVSLLSVLGKIMEKIVFKYVFNYLNDHSRISRFQSGFIPGVSTVSQLIEIYHEFCSALSNKAEIRIVFLDISKAFDRVWHKGLIHKLSQCGISGSLITWFTSYLSNRQQRVVINGRHSEWANIHAGVPQGSVLGPLLFLVYINDLVDVVQHCQIRMFADDTCLFIESNNRKLAQQALDSDLASISVWADRWLVNFSPTKTEAMLISNKTDEDSIPDITFQGSIIKNVSFHKHLGVYLSSNLKWAKHIDYLCDVACKKLWALKRLKYILDRKSLETIYLYFIRPSLEYADVLWAGVYENETLKLNAIEIEAMRCVTGATARSNIAKLWEDSGWASLSERRDIHCLLSLFKILMGPGPGYLKALIPQTVGERTHYPLRTQENLSTPFTRLDIFKRSFIPRSLNLWNNLDLSIRQSASIVIFKNKISPVANVKKHFYYEYTRWAAVQHARIRMGCSQLNAHLCNNLHVVEHQSCVCGNFIEDPFHYFMECTRYNALRNSLILDVAQFSDINIKTFLYGNQYISEDDNCKIFDAVQRYIIDSKRFN